MLKTSISLIGTAMAPIGRVTAHRVTPGRLSPSEFPDDATGEAAAPSLHRLRGLFVNWLCSPLGHLARLAIEAGARSINWHICASCLSGTLYCGVTNANLSRDGSIGLAGIGGARRGGVSCHAGRCGAQLGNVPQLSCEQRHRLVIDLAAVGGTEAGYSRRTGVAKLGLTARSRIAVGIGTIAASRQARNPFEEAGQGLDPHRS